MDALEQYELHLRDEVTFFVMLKAPTHPRLKPKRMSSGVMKGMFLPDDAEINHQRLHF